MIQGLRDEKKRNSRLKQKHIYKAFLEARRKFPFKDYMEKRLPKYSVVCSLVMEEISLGSKICDVGCGSCDLTGVLSNLGYAVTGVDDLRDPWHLIGTNQSKIKNFANEMGVKLINESIESAKLKEKSFDGVLLLDVLEHSPTPRPLLNRAISIVKPGGLVLIETPNSVMLAKRILGLMGKSNYPNVNFIYFNVGSYRGHVREYNVSELKRLLKVSGLIKVEAKSMNIETSFLMPEWKGLKRIVKKFYGFVSKLYPSFRDTILIWARKPESWSPLDDLKAIESLKSCYPHIVKYNLENEPNDILVRRLKARARSSENRNE